MNNRNWQDDLDGQPTERELAELIGLIDDIQDWSYFDEAGILTDNQGLVLNINGAEFQVTIIRTNPSQEA